MLPQAQENMHEGDWRHAPANDLLSVELYVLGPKKLSWRIALQGLNKSYLNNINKCSIVFSQKGKNYRAKEVRIIYLDAYTYVPLILILKFAEIVGTWMKGQVQYVTFSSVLKILNWLEFRLYIFIFNICKYT